MTMTLFVGVLVYENVWKCTTWSLDGRPCWHLHIHPKKLPTCPLATSFSWHITSWARMWRRMSYLHRCTMGMIWPLGSRWHLVTEPWACCILSTLHSTSTFIISSQIHHHLWLIHLLHLKLLLGMSAASLSPSLAGCTSSTSIPTMPNCPLPKPYLKESSNFF